MATDLPIDRARRNLAFVKARRPMDPAKQAELEMAAFLDFMHPAMDQERKDRMIRAAGQKDEPQ